MAAMGIGIVIGHRYLLTTSPLRRKKFAITINVPTVGGNRRIDIEVLVPVLLDPVTMRVIPVPATVGVTLITCQLTQGEGRRGSL